METHGSDPRDQPGDRRWPAEPATATADPRGVLTGWSESARLLLGHTADQAVGRPAADLLGTEPPREALRACAAHRPWRGLLRLRHLAGHWLAVEVRIEPLLDGAGRLLAHQLFALPVERLRSEQDLTLLEWSFDQSPAQFATYDLELRRRWINDTACRAFKIRKADVRGFRLEEGNRGAVSAEYLRRLRQVLETGLPVHFESRTRKPGMPDAIAWDTWLWPVRDLAGQLCGVSVASIDGTEQQLARDRLALLNEAGIRIGSTLDVVQTAQELTDMAVPRLADFASVDLLEGLWQGEEPVPGPIAGPVAMRRAAHRSATGECPGVGAITAYAPGSPPADCLATGRSALLGAADPAFVRWPADHPGSADRRHGRGQHSMMVVPLSARGALLGVAVFTRSAHPEPFVQDDLLLAEELVARASLCVDNARRFTREHTTALALQRSLLPQRLPGQAAVEVAFRYLPAGSQAGVGGDWFDVVPLSGTRVALVVGDVVGHGIQASATMGRLRTAVRTLADVDLPPDELLTHLDDLVSHLAADEDRVTDPASEGGGDVGATCLYAVYDPVSRSCCLASAGHPVPAVVAPDGTVDFFDVAPGPPLGLGGLPFEAAERQLPEGSLLVLYTDGLIESRDRDVDEGLAELRRVLAIPAASLEATCDQVLRALLPGRPSDDVALLIARTLAFDPARVATWEVPYDPAAVAEVRAAAGQRLAEWGLVEAGFITELVVSELVTNAIRYGRPPIRLRLIRDDHALVCEVSDTSSTAPHLRRARVFDEGGRGLLLVAQLTQRWGTRQASTGKTIWAEQALPPL
ncbi:SpoIIE family protein phosphatase [Streptomyces sp. NPDC092296]|uniref:SpoIIE family protein phosphatase n=1 Tax=Streptomyces sp. NPDC092296 TaxID=3366012 RepID=UPI00381B9A4A